MPRRRRPKIQPPRRRFFLMQWWLQPLSFASPAWQARHANGSAAARRPYLAYTSALPRDCCSGVSMSAGGGSDSAVIDSRYKPARQREILGGSTSSLTHSSAAKRRLREAWFVSTVSAHGMVCSSASLPRRQREMGHARGCPSRRNKRAAARLLQRRLYERRGVPIRQS
jgi:hypothetical protein